MGEDRNVGFGGCGCEWIIWIIIIFVIVCLVCPGFFGGGGFFL